jgi:integrase
MGRNNRRHRFDASCTLVLMEQTMKNSSVEKSQACVLQEGAERQFEELVSQLPPLPSVLRYHDDFNDEIRSIKEIEGATACVIHQYGGKVSIDFSSNNSKYSLFKKSVFVFLVAEGRHSATCAGYLSGSSKISFEDAIDLFTSSPEQVRPKWQIFLTKSLPANTYSFAKAALRMLCAYRVSGWSETYLPYLSQELPLPRTDAYAGVRSGDVFLSVDEEAAIVRYIDTIAHSISSGCMLTYEELVNVCMLISAYQFGMRPVQIASLSVSDVKIIAMQDGTQAAHLSFRMVKQRRNLKTKPLLRKVKHEWAIIFSALKRFSSERRMKANDRIFLNISANDAGGKIASLASDITCSEIHATDFRHTAAQRLVDAGASQEELAEFLGHSDITTSLVYFTSSKNQAERINKALGLSPIFNKVSEIAHSKFISKDELAGLRGDQQVAGIPHGIPIAGIGGCQSGQPACPNNPILSCYGCPKFMPVRDAAMHEQTLTGLRDVVQLFISSSRNEQASPAFMQLSRAISDVQAVIGELENRDA